MATKADGSVVINTKMNTKGLNAGFNQISNGCKSALGSLGKIGKTMTAALSGAAIVAFGKKAIDLGSDLAEVQNVVDVVFPKMSAQIDDFAKNAAESFGLSETMAKKYAGTFGAMADAFGFAEKESYDMATALTGLAGDVASFYNITQDEAYTKLKSVFSGETETLKDLGVVMTQSALDSYAMAQGIGKTTSQMTEQEKVALRYRFVMDQLSTSSGDFARTSGGWANQIRMLKLNLESFMATIGQGLINLLTPALKMLNSAFAALQRLAEGFKKLTELITGNKSTASDLSGGYDAAADAASGIAASMDDVTKATEKAAEAQHNLSGLDEINIFTDPKSSGSSSTSNVGTSSAGTTAAPTVDFGKVAEGSTIFDKLKESMGGVLSRLNELKNKFAEGFKNGFGDTLDTFDRIKERAKSIAGTVSNIFTDPEVQDAQKKFEDSTAKLFGTVTGTAGKVGGAIGENLSTGVDRSLKKNEPRIKKHIIKMFDIGTDINNKLTEATSSVGDILSGVISSDAATGISENIVSIFTNIGMTVQSTLSGVFNDCLGMITRPITENKDQIEKNLTEFLGPIAGITESLDNLTAKASDGFTKLFDEHVHPCLESIQDGLSEIVGNMLTVWGEKVQPWLNKVGERIKGVIDGPVGNAVSQAQRLVGNLWDFLHGLWNDFLKPFLSWVGEHFVAKIGSVLTFIGDRAATVIGTISGILGGIWRTLNGLIDFIRGTFTGDWERAWNGIKDFFGGIWDAIAAAVKGPINAMIDAVNYVIRGIINTLNSALDLLQFTAPDWVPGIGGKTVGFDIPDITPPQIPHLARGAVIPPNAPFTAVLGDQTKGYNIETPEALLRKIVREESSSGGGNTYRFVAQLDRRTIFDQTIREAKNRKIQTGGNPFELA